MLYVEAVRGFAMGILLVAITGCGGGGGSGGGSAKPAPLDDSNASVLLPNIEHATEKTLTRDNAWQALMLASNFAGIIDSLAPYPSLADLRGDTASSKTRVGYKLHSGVQVARATVDVSDDVCISGQAIGEQLSATKVSVKFDNCDVGDVIYDGLMVQEDINPLPASVGLYEITTFDGLHATATDRSLDVVFDGKVEVLVSDTQFGDVGETGMIEATLDIRDLQEQKGASLRNYQSDFELVGAPGGGVAVNLLGRNGTIYDENDEYFSLSTVDPGSDAALFLSANISDYVPLQRAIRYMMNTYPEKVSMGLHGLDSDLYVFDDASSDGARLQLVVPPDICGPVNSTGGGFGFTFPHAFPFTPACYLRISLDDVTPATVNDFAPVINLDDINTAVTAGQYFAIPHLDVKDADQQFVSIFWELISGPGGAVPMYFSWNDGFLFSSSIAGTYEFRVTVADGIHTTEQVLTITVNY